MSYADYAKYAEVVDKRSGKLTTAEVEDEFWSTINDKNIDVKYSIDNDMSLFSKQTNCLNLNTLSQNASSIHGHVR